MRITSGGGGGAGGLTILREKVITFDGAAGTGAVGSVPLYDVNANIRLVDFTPVVTTTLVGVGANLLLGLSGDTDFFVGSTALAQLTAGKVWFSTTPNAVGAVYPDTFITGVLSADIIITVTDADVTAGEITCYLRYEAIGDGAAAAS